jgi:leucyl aminopeptidase (aminopeptidase T)
MKPTVTLTAYNMGADTIEADFECWCDYVDEHLGEACGFAVNVERAPFTSGPASDVISNASDEQADTIREALREFWNQADWEPGATPPASDDETAARADHEHDRARDDRLTGDR